MQITFKHYLDAKSTQAFETVYEPGLQLEDEDKNWLIQHGLAAWLLVDGKLAGETYGAVVRDILEEETPEEYEGSDLEWYTDVCDYPEALYCYSTTVLPEFQGKGLGQLLKAHWLGLASPLGVKTIGHSTSPQMKAINSKFGANHLCRHTKWYGTDRVAWFYEVDPG